MTIEHSFEMRFGLENAAFAGNDRAPNVALILRQIAAQIDQGRTDGFVADHNGNRVGNWGFEPAPPEEES